MSNRNGSEQGRDLGAFGYFAAIFLCCAIVGALTYNFGRQNERREQVPASYAEAAKTDAQRACVGREGAAAFECIYDRVEASQEQARGEQDLTAQQIAANSAFMSAIIAFFTLVITGVGAWLIRETLVATQDAVKEAEKATEAANAAVRETTRIGEAQIRCYLVATSAVFSILNDGRFFATCTLKNTGQSPAENIIIAAELTMFVTGQAIDEFQCKQNPVMDKVYSIASGTEEELGPIGFGALMGQFKQPSVLGKSEIYISVDFKVTACDVFKKPIEIAESFQFLHTGDIVGPTFLKLERGHRVQMKAGA
ncbi:MAG: hypothetical protein KA312_09525 [Sphingorhabdus sp.]|nr:hypothetical protein [Sphingorhabdus sp.]